MIGHIEPSWPAEGSTTKEGWRCISLTYFCSYIFHVKVFLLITDWVDLGSVWSKLYLQNLNFIWWMKENLLCLFWFLVCIFQVYIVLLGNKIVEVWYLNYQQPIVVTLDPVDRLESFRSLKLSRLEIFLTLKS